MKTTDFFLISNESDLFIVPRKCRVLRRITYDGNEDCMIIEINPKLIGQRFGLGGEDLGLLLISAKPSFSCLFPISEWPVFINVYRLKTECIGKEKLLSSDAELIDWGELYGTLEAATSALM